MCYVNCSLYLIYVIRVWNVFNDDTKLLMFLIKGGNKVENENWKIIAFLCILIQYRNHVLVILLARVPHETTWLPESICYSLKHMATVVFVARKKDCNKLKKKIPHLNFNVCLFKMKLIKTETQTKTWVWMFLSKWRLSLQANTHGVYLICLNCLFVYLASIFFPVS